MYTMKSPYRDDFTIRGYWFGRGGKAVAIVGAMRGDEIQQQYTCARLVGLLRDVERGGGIRDGRSVLVIPTCNPFSMNVGRRFWAMDGTDINRMFPGYAKGETTQRIAAAIFSSLQGFTYGVQMASFYIPGSFVPHVRVLQTGYEDTATACLFGLPFVTVRKPLPFDTTLLNYNWQVWDTKAFSIYAGSTGSIDHRASRQATDAVLRFMRKAGVITHRVQAAGYESAVINEADLVSVAAPSAGLFEPLRNAGDEVSRGDTLARIIDPYTADTRAELAAPASGTIFFAHDKPLALEHGITFRIHPCS